MSDQREVNAPCAEAWFERDEHRRRVVEAHTSMMARVAAGIEAPVASRPSLPVVGGALPSVEPPPPPSHDLVNHPPHYTVGGIETIDFIEAKGLDYCAGQVVKYLVRHQHKGDPLTDLRKAEWYLKRLIARVEAGQAGSP